jgi:hypothetical protein
MAKHFVLLLCLLSLARAGYTQNEPEQVANSRWQLGIVAGYEKNYQRFHTSDTVSTSATNFSNVGKRIPFHNFHIGISALYNINQQWKFETGLLYVPSFSATLKYDLPFKTTAVSGFDTIVSGNLRQEFKPSYLYVPLHMKRVVKSNERTDWFVSAGSGVWILLLKSEDYNIGLPQNNYRMKYNPLIASWYVGAGCFIRLSDDILLKIEPGLRGTFTSVLREPDSGSYFHPTLSFNIIYTE